MAAKAPASQHSVAYWYIFFDNLALSGLLDAFRELAAMQSSRSCELMTNKLNVDIVLLVLLLAPKQRTPLRRGQVHLLRCNLGEWHCIRDWNWGSPGIGIAFAADSSIVHGST